MTNNIRKLAWTLRQSARNSNTAASALRSAVQNDRSRLKTELEEYGTAVMRDASGREYRIERVAER
ncbi:MAG TPA: hypothetical protein VM865_09820 [Acidobacteriaceae bacterium]|jgi:hypothetical protein|nr:hypothetical protein [Acidobacteriaceae bacterium]